MVRRALAHTDLTVAMGLLALGLLEALFLVEAGPAWVQATLTPIWTIPLVWRRRWPVLVLAIVIALGPILDLVSEQGGVTSFVLSAITAAFTVGRELDAPATWWGPALTVGFGWLFYGVTGGDLSDFVFIAVLYGGAWAVGHTIRNRALQVDELAQQAQELRRAQAERERRAVEDERARIARELHDIVAHSLSVIGIQVQALRRRMESRDPSEAKTLGAIEFTARQAMGEMRRLLGVLRADGDRSQLTPQPGLDQLPALLEEVRRAGVGVDLEVEGEPVALSPGVGLVVYRVVQEALTNVRKHAGPTGVVLSLRYSPNSIEICVTNGDRQGTNSSADGEVHEPGYGLIGMRERVSLYGGTLKASPLPEGGFSLVVSVPLSYRGGT